MPKPFGGGQATQAAMPSPAPTAPGAAQTPGFVERMKSRLPEQGSQARHDMIMKMVQAGMSSAQGSTSPLVSLLAPIAGAMIEGGATSKRNEAASVENSEMSASILGDKANDPKLQGYLEVLNNPNAPSHLKSIAKSRLDAALKPPTASRSGTGGTRSSGGGKPVSGQRNVRIVGNYDIGGVMHGRDPYGRMVPYISPDGKPVPSRVGRPGSPPADPSQSVVDELVELTKPSAPAPTTTASPAAPAMPVAPALDENDPLGILAIPPA